MTSSEPRVLEWAGARGRGRTCTKVNLFFGKSRLAFALLMPAGVVRDGWCDASG
jgi:hypothetical protein